MPENIEDLDEGQLEKILGSEEVQKLLAYDEHDLDTVADILEGFKETDGYSGFVKSVQERHSGRLSDASVDKVISAVIEEINTAYE